MTIVTRIAPTPSGYLHRGNAYNFLLIWLLTRTYGGKIWLRIDDLDLGRLRPRFVEGIFSDLSWMGIDWDFGPMVVDDVPVFSQHSRLDMYQNALETLRDHPDVFGCSCSRKMIKMTGSTTYPGTCCGQTVSENNIWRISMKGETVLNGEYMQLQDSYISLRSAQGVPSYHLACVVDDIFHGVNVIIRGSDLFSSSLSQSYLRTILGIVDQPYHLHHGLLLDEQGKKLSKSTGSLPISFMRESGEQVCSLYASFAKWRGWKHSPQSLEELMEGFREEDSWSRISIFSS